MAAVDTLSIPVTGDDGKTKRSLIHFPSGLAVADIQGFWTAAAPEFDLIHDGITGQPTLRTTLINPGGLKPSAVIDSTPRRMGLLAFDPADTNFGWTQNLPALGATYIVTGSFNADHADIVAWRTRMLSGEAGPPVRLPSDRYGGDLTAFVDADVTFRK